MATEAPRNPGAPGFGPSDSLIAMFRACSRDPTQAVEARLRHMLHLFLQHNRDEADDRKTKERCCWQAGTWYYMILENLLKHESKTLGTTAVSSLLEYNLLQRCLVTCCLEIAMCLNRLPGGFPLLLRVFGLAPYHFCKVIELTVRRADVRLPDAVVRHLAQLEQRVLESWAWTRDSPLWEAIRANGGRMPTCQQVVPSTQLEDPQRTEVNDDRKPPGDAPTSSHQQRPGRSGSFHVFARKVYNLTGERLRELCSVLNIRDELRFQIWTCFEHSLVHCTSLMMDRHLDQMLMCAIYITAKITKMEIPFKHIKNCYMFLPHADKSVWKNVLMSGSGEGESQRQHSDGDHSAGFPTPDSPSAHYPSAGQEEQTGDLIHFFNQVYSTRMQSFVELFDPTFGGETPPSSPYPQQRKASPRRHRLSSSPHIFVSLLKPGTPPRQTTGLCYVFSSSSSERLHEINNMIKTGRSPQRRSRAETGDDGPSAKRLRRDGQSAWQRRLRDVVSERVARRDQEQEAPVTKL